ncbi:MAG: hypothetical protein E7J75_14690, partial [Blautia sp.]|nr:hypothetical protein [Blautia sp.]
GFSSYPGTPSNPFLVIRALQHCLFCVIFWSCYNYAKDIASRVKETYGSKIAIFENVIPLSVKVAEASAEGKSIYCHCPNGKVSMAYENLTQEVLENEK